MTLLIKSKKSLPETDTRFATCLDDIVVSLSRKKDMNFRFMYIDSWNFKYPTNGINIENINHAYKSNSPNLTYNLKKYHGVKIDYKNVTNSDEILNKISSNLLQNLPTIVHFDNYYCPWEPLILKGQRDKVPHSNHLCIAVGLNREQDYIELTDPFFLEENRKVSIETFNLASKFYSNFELEQGANEIEEIEWKKILYRKIENSHLNNDFSAGDGMRKFAEDFKYKWDLKNHINLYPSYWETPLSDFLRLILLNRYRFQSLLNSISLNYKNDNMKASSILFNTIISKWEMVFSLIAKSVLKDNINDKKGAIASKIVEIANHEEEIAKKIVSDVRKSNTLTMTNKFISKKEERYSELININLSHLYNNKGFGNTVSTNCPADLTGVGEYFLYEDEHFLKKQKFNGFDINFSPFNLLYDNISCSGQKVEFASDSYKTLVLVGCSEWGNYTEKIELLYEDFKQDLSISFSDLATRKILSNEKVMWTGKTIEKTKSNAFIKQKQANIFLSHYNLKSDKKLSGLILPNCPNIHIFACALAK